MALKIVHLCDVHSAKGDDVPAQYAHTLTLDGGTYAIDLCPACDAEKFLPMVAFLDAFGLLTDGAVDPREAVAENLRLSAGVATSKPTRVRVRASSFVPEDAPQDASAAPVAAPAAPEALATPEAEERLYPSTRARLPQVRQMLLEAPEGIRADVMTSALNLSHGALTTALDVLREAGRAEYLGHRWWAPENVPQAMRAELEAKRAVVAARNTVPRICPVDGEAISGTSQWHDHCTRAHGAPPAQILGLVCPLDGEAFSHPQVLGMHGRKEHDAVHTPQLFQLAIDAGDPVGIVAGIRKEYGRAD